MDETRNVEAEELELLHDITRFLLRRGQQLYTKYAVQDIADIRPAVSETMTMEGPVATEAAPAPKPAPLPDACQDCGADFSQTGRNTLFVGGKAVHLCQECRDARDRAVEVPPEQPLCGTCNRPLEGDDLEPDTMNAQWRRRKIVTKLTNQDGQEKEDVTHEYVITCKACYDEKPEDEITIHAPGGLPPRTDEKVTVEA